MRKQFLSLLTMFVAAGSAVVAPAQTSVNKTGLKLPTRVIDPALISPLVSTDIRSALLPSTDLKYSNESQALSYTNLTTMNYLMVGNVNPICYDPVSNILGVAFCEPSQDQSQTRLLMRFSTNGGQSLPTGSSNLKQFFIRPASNEEHIVPQVSFNNPTKGTKITDLNFFSSTLVNKNPTSTTSTYGVTFQFTEGSNSNPSPASDVSLDGPTSNNPSKYTWGTRSGLSSYTAANGTGFFMFGGVLSPPTDVQYGPYGALVMESDINDYSASIPTAWDYAQFQQSPSKTTSFSGPMYIDADPNGVIYAATNAVFEENKNVRVVSFSTSTDKGKTWSQFTRMPDEIKTNYATAHDGDALVVLDPYGQDAFVVTGADQFSYFYTAGVAKENQFVSFEIVEVTYNKGTWDMRKVSPITTVPNVMLYNSDSTKENGYTRLVAFLDSNPLGNELQAAKTRDGKSIVLKWIDINPKRKFTFAAQNVKIPVNGGDPLDSVLTETQSTDVYASSRSIDGSAWNPAANLTDDDYYDKGTKIPLIVADASKLPIIVSRAIAATRWNETNQTGKLLRALPQNYLNMFYNISHDLAYTRANVVVSVEDDQNTDNGNYNFALNAPSPNPSEGIANLSFSNNVAGLVHLGVYNTLGEEVYTVLNTTLQPGAHGYVLNTENLNSGTYYVTLNVNGVSQTRPLVIVH